MSVNQKKKAKEAEKAVHSSGKFSRQEAVACKEAKTISDGQAISKMLLKYKISKDNMYSGVYKVVMELKKKYPQVKLMIKPNLTGDFVLHPQDKMASSCLDKEGVSSAYASWMSAGWELKSAVMSYPEEFPMELLEKLPSIAEATCCIPSKQKTAMTSGKSAQSTSISITDINNRDAHNIRKYMQAAARAMRCPNARVS